MTAPRNKRSRGLSARHQLAMMELQASLDDAGAGAAEVPTANEWRRPRVVMGYVRNHRYFVKVEGPRPRPDEPRALQQRIRSTEAIEPSDPMFAEARRRLPELRAALAAAQDPHPELFEVPVTSWYLADEAQIPKLTGLPPSSDFEVFVGPINDEWFFLCLHVRRDGRTLLALLNSTADNWVAEFPADVARDALQWARACVTAGAPPATPWQQQPPRERQ